MTNPIRPTVFNPSDDELREIAREAASTGTYSGGVKSLRAVWDKAAEPQRTAQDFEDRRTRSEALERSVEVTSKLGLGKRTYGQVVDVAKIFEKYLKEGK